MSPTFLTPKRYAWYTMDKVRLPSDQSPLAEHLAIGDSLTRVSAYETRLLPNKGMHVVAVLVVVESF